MQKETHPKQVYRHGISQTNGLLGWHGKAKPPSIEGPFFYLIADEVKVKSAFPALTEALVGLTILIFITPPAPT